MVPREVYTLGAVQFDTRPLVKLQGELLAKREAKQKAEEEAIDKYVLGYAGKLTPTGVRTNDLSGFETRRKAWVDFALQNKSKIKTDPLVRAESDRLYNNALTYIQASKNEEEKGKPAKTMLFDPSKRSGLNTEALMSDISLHDLPLDDPNRKSIDYNAAWYRSPSFDFNKEFTEASKGQPKSFLRVVPNSQNKTLGTVATEEGWTPKSINAIADNFVRSVRDNPDKYEYYVRRAKKYTPAELADLNKELVDTGIIADDDNPLGVAYAEALRQAKSAIDVIQKPDTELAQQRGLKRAYASKSASSQTGQVDLTPYRDEGDSKDVSEIFQGVKVTGLPRGESMIAKKILYNKGRNEVTVTEWVGRDIEGNPTGEQKRTIPFNVFLQNIKTLNPQADFKYIETLPTAKLNAPAKEKEPAYSIKGKTYSQSQLLKMYTQDQINQALKAGTVKIKQ